MNAYIFYRNPTCVNVYPQKKELNTVPESVLLHFCSAATAGTRRGIVVRVEYNMQVPAISVTNHSLFSFLKYNCSLEVKHCPFLKSEGKHDTDLVHTL